MKSKIQLVLVGFCFCNLLYSAQDEQQFSKIDSLTVLTSQKVINWLNLQDDISANSQYEAIPPCLQKIILSELLKTSFFKKIVQMPFFEKLMTSQEDDVWSFIKKKIQPGCCHALADKMSFKDFWNCISSYFKDPKYYFETTKDKNNFLLKILKFNKHFNFVFSKSEELDSLKNCIKIVQERWDSTSKRLLVMLIEEFIFDPVNKRRMFAFKEIFPVSFYKKNPAVKRSICIPLSRKRSISKSLYDSIDMFDCQMYDQESDCLKDEERDYLFDDKHSNAFSAPELDQENKDTNCLVSSALFGLQLVLTEFTILTALQDEFSKSVNLCFLQSRSGIARENFKKVALNVSILKKEVFMVHINNLKTTLAQIELSHEDTIKYNKFLSNLSTAREKLISGNCFYEIDYKE